MASLLDIMKLKTTVELEKIIQAAQSELQSRSTKVQESPEIDFVPQKTDLIKMLKVVLASSFTLYLKTQFYHWNVTGANFSEYHQLFGEQYNEIYEAIDLIAEQIRQMGSYSPGSYDRFKELSIIPSNNNTPSTKMMFKILEQDHRNIIEYIKNVITCAQDIREEGVANLLTDRLEAHSKHLWMIRSIIQ